MRKLNVSDSGRGYMRLWELSTLPEEKQKNICKLKNDRFWNEWGMVIG
ncbi:MAG: hypothetical protein KHZ73_04650 [Lachnospiraceae bacterium]|nr:hypothetical protein [Lachnospiraceae bacterium]